MFYFKNQGLKQVGVLMKQKSICYALNTQKKNRWLQ